MSKVRKAGTGGQLWRVGMGVGLAGGVLLALRYALSPPSRPQLPGWLSPDAFSTRLFPGVRGDLVYHEGGGGTPLLFLHAPAIGGSSYEWSLVYPALADRGHVFALDLPGFGESQKPGGMITAEDQVVAIAQFVDAVCGGPVILVASGLAAGFGAMLASQHPELVSRLCLFMPTGLSEFGRRRVTWRAGVLANLPVLNRMVYRNVLARRSAIRRWLGEFAFWNEAKVSEEMVDAYSACAQQTHAEHAIYSLMTGRLGMPIEARLRSLTQPVRLVWGERCVFPPVEWADRYRELIPGAELTVIPETGFLAALESPRQALGVIETFLPGGMSVVRGS